MTILSRFPLRKYGFFITQITRANMSTKPFKTKIPRRKGMLQAPEAVFETPQQGNMLPGFMKSCIFTAAFCCTAYVGASIWEYENRRSVKRSIPMWEQNLGYYKEFQFRTKLNKWWNNLNETRQAFWSICGVNVLVFCAWNYAPFNPFMLRYFCSSPATKAVCIPLILSAFSHYNAVHLLMNMAVLNAFSKNINRDMSKEQFLGFYLSSAVFSGLFSNGIRIAKGAIGPSLGASGAIMALLAFTCATHPEDRFNIVLLPNYDFSPASVLKFVIAFDLAGLIFKFRLFDHGAHLGGTLFGLAYAYIGYNALWRNRHHLINKWKVFTEKFK